MIDLNVTETGGHEALVTRTGLRSKGPQFLRSEYLGLNVGGIRAQDPVSTGEQGLRISEQGQSHSPLGADA